MLKVLRGRAASDGPSDAMAGTVIGSPRGTAGVVTGEGVLWLEEVQLAGKRALPVNAFAAGARGSSAAVCLDSHRTAVSARGGLWSLDGHETSCYQVALNTHRLALICQISPPWV